MSGAPAGIALPRHFLDAWALLSELAAVPLLHARPDEGILVLWSTEAGALLGVSRLGLVLRLPRASWPLGFWRWTTSLDALAEEAMSVERVLQTLQLQPGEPPVLAFQRGEGTFAELVGDPYDASEYAESLFSKRLLPLFDLPVAEARPILDLFAATMDGARTVTLDARPDGVFLSARVDEVSCNLKWDAANSLDLSMSFGPGIIHPRMLEGLDRFRWHVVEDAKGLAIELGPNLALIRGATCVRAPLPVFAAAAPARGLLDGVGNLPGLLAEGDTALGGLALSPFESLLLPSLRYVASGTGSPCATFDIADDTFFEVVNFQVGDDSCPREFSVNLSHRHPEGVLFDLLDRARPRWGWPQAAMAAVADEPGYVTWLTEAADAMTVVNAVSELLNLVWGEVPTRVREIRWRRLDSDSPPFERCCSLAGPTALLAATQLTLGSLAPDDAREAWAESAFALVEDDDRILRTVVTRDPVGQQAFRDALAQRNGPSCVISGCTLLAIVEAAHLDPFRADSDHDVRNGLLLRVDLHRLFDARHLAIEPETLEVHVSPEARQAGYGEFHGQKLSCPLDARPDRAPLERRWADYCKRWGV